MAQLIQNAAEANNWNPALRPEDTTDAGAAVPTGGSSPGLLAKDGEAEEAPTSDLKSPLSDEDFSAWEMSHETGVASTQGAENGTSLADMSGGLEKGRIESMESEPSKDPDSSQTTVAKAQEAPSNPSPEVAQAAEPEPTQTPSLLEGSAVTTEPSDNHSHPVPQETELSELPSEQNVAQADFHTEQSTQVTAGEHVLSAQPDDGTPPAPSNDVNDQGEDREFNINESTSPVTQAQIASVASSLAQQQPHEDQPAPVEPAADESGTKPVSEAIVPSALAEHSEFEAAFEAAIAQSAQRTGDQPQATPDEPKGNDAGNLPVTDEISQQSEAQQSGPDGSSMETHAINGHGPWTDNADGEVDSDGDDFFNQLKTQTKPIFAPPESESRFEEGVHLLDDTTPISPPRAVPPRKSADNPFGDDEEDGEDFFSAIRKPDASEKPPFHFARKSTSQVVGSMGFGVDSPTSDISAAAQLDDVLKSVANEEPVSQAHAPQEQTQAPEPTEEELAARWEAELSDTGEEDLAARWEAALDDDDDMLLGDDAVQAPATEQQPVLQSPITSPNNVGPTGLNSPFETPQSYAQPRAAPSAYTPHQPSTADLVQGMPTLGAAPVPSYFSQQPQNPVATRGESFAERSKQGYKSPYDLPDDLSRPRRPIAASKPVSPKVDNHMPPPPRAPGQGKPPVSSAMPPPASVPTPTATAPPPAAKNFFEELPLPPPKPRPASSGRYTPGPSAATHNVPPLASPPRSQHAPITAPAPPMVPQAQSSLQPPERLEPYTSTLTSSAPAGPSVASRYSPKPPGPQASGKPPSTSRYSPAPPPAGSAARNRYASQPLGVPGNQSTFPFQPRTSSPLAYHEKASYQTEGQQNQPPSLQPSVDLSPPRAQRPSVDQGSFQVPQTLDASSNGLQQEDSKFPNAQRQTPPPPKSRYAPPEYVNEFAKRVAPPQTYAPPAPTAAMPTSPQAAEPQMAPLRSQTQSPGQQMTSPGAPVPPMQTLPRPASVHGSSSPTKTVNPYAPAQPSVQTRARALSRGLKFIPPTDGQEYDTLERWKGAPIFKFGFGGAVVSCFPKHIPRYSAGQATPMIKASPGEPKFSQASEWLPTGETLVQHPGPLKTKSKKKDILAWLSSKIAVFENEPTPDFDRSGPDSQRRHEEKILLWKVIKILVENDGVLEGSPVIQQSLRQALFPNAPETGPEATYGNAFASSLGSTPLNVLSQPDAVEPQLIEELRNSLLQGDREKAVWGAVDRRLWGHAMIIASTMDRSVWKQVVQEFIRREIRSTTANTESLAALYEIFAGNIEESIDELVPPSARAGHHLISKADGHDATKNALDGLNSWRDTLGLVLNNRSSEDHQALLALGRLLASYGRTEAAHICFISSRAAVFGGADDPQANIVLLGVDHQRMPSALIDEDAILLTEVYEYATAVLANSPVANLPYLLAFKVLHAKQLADRGRKVEAQNYCDGVAASLKATTRPSPYHHQQLFIEVDELSARLRQTTSDGSSSWISKPSMEKVSGSMWARFNSFVAGDDSDAASTGSGKAGETADFGPFANVAGTPTVSRSPSVSDLYGSYPGTGAPPLPAGGSSRYTPASNQYAPNASPEQFRGRSSLDSQRSSSYGGMQYGQRRASQDQPSPPVDSHMFQGAPAYGSPGATGYQPTPPQSSYMPLAPVEEDASTHTQSPADAAPAGQPAVNGLFYQPPAQDPASASQSPYYQGPPGMPQSGSSSYMPSAAANAYEPPSGGSSYEPPSYAPQVNVDPAPEETEESAEQDEKPKKKKSFMDDDDDDDLAKRAAAIQKAENDRKAEEAFRKAAEEDGKQSTSSSLRPNLSVLTHITAKKDAQQPAKKGWFGGWFGGGKKEADNAGGGPIKAKLGEENSFYYDKDLKKWVNKKDPGSAEPVRATPPPPRGSAPPSRASSGSMPPPPPPGPPMSTASGSRPPSSSSDAPPSLSSSPAFSGLGVPPTSLGNMPRSVSTGASSTGPPGSSSGPAPPRPTSSLSHAQSIDDLLGAPQARKGNTVRGKKKGRYVDVMAK